MLYQRKNLATGEDIGAPAPLPPELVGLSDAGLADLSAHLSPEACEQLGFAGHGFVSIAPGPLAAPPVRIGKYWLFQRFSEDQERQFAKLEYQARALTPADLDDPDPLKQALFQLQRFLRRLDALSVLELNAAETLAGFELLRLLGVFGDPASPASQEALIPILAPPEPREIA